MGGYRQIPYGFGYKKVDVESTIQVALQITLFTACLQDTPGTYPKIRKPLFLL